MNAHSKFPPVQMRRDTPVDEATRTFPMVELLRNDVLL